MEKVTITWGDGTKTEAKLNGNSYAVAKEFEPTDLSTVTIEKKDETIVMENPIFIETAKLDHHFWFSFVERTDEEKIAIQVAKQRADIDYIAIVSDIDLEEA
jgi:hypothetical protein